MWKRLPSELKWGMVIFGLLNLPFFLFKLDISLISHFYHPDNPYPWSLRAKYPWNLLYYFGSYPASITAIAALFVLVLSYFRKDLYRFRKKALYLVVVLVLGPGLVINAVFKDHYGRPRPREVNYFGGQQPYYYPLEPAFAAKGKSFPCGHCSMGFYFFSLFFLFRYRKKWLSLLSFSFAVIYGLLIGIARIGQGGHFPSDVLWSGGMVYFIAGFLYYYVFHLDKEDSVKQHPDGISEVKKGHKYAALFGGTLFSMLIILGVLVATPISQDKLVSVDEQIKHLAVQADQGDLRVSSAENNANQLEFHTEGFGLPGCRLIVQSEILNDSLMQLNYHVKGFHTEEKTTVNLLMDSVDSLSWRVRSSHILLDSMITIHKIYLDIREGFVTVFRPVKVDTIRIHAMTPNKKWYFKNFRNQNFITMISGTVQTLKNDQWINGIHYGDNPSLILRFPEKAIFLITGN